MWSRRLPAGCERYPKSAPTRNRATPGNLSVSVVVPCRVVRGQEAVRMTTWRSTALALLFLPALLAAQAPGGIDSRVFYYPKPLVGTAWQPPMKPVTRLAEVKGRHHAEPAWREPVIQDENTRAFLVQEPPGTTHARKLYPDSPAWWAVLEGRI